MGGGVDGLLLPISMPRFGLKRKITMLFAVTSNETISKSDLLGKKNNLIS